MTRPLALSVSVSTAPYRNAMQAVDFYSPFPILFLDCLSSKDVYVLQGAGGSLLSRRYLDLVWQFLCDGMVHFSGASHHLRYGICVVGRNQAPTRSGKIFSVAQRGSAWLSVALVSVAQLSW